MVHVSNHMMSHILHFYHLVALDYVKPVAFAGGGFLPLTRPFLAPRYDDSYYINSARVLGMAPLLPPAAVATLATLPGWGVNPGDAVNNYLTGQYLRALNIRRVAHELQAIFAGRAPQCNGFTPGGVTTSFTAADIASAQAKLDTIKAFVGEPLDFATGTAGTMMFDVVAAAHLYPEYFWIGNSYGYFLAFGWGEEAGAVPLSGNLGGVFGNMPNSSGDNRASARGYKLSAQAGAPLYPVNIMNIGESIANSRYQKDGGGNYPTGQPFKHPWSGKTQPDANAEYSWLKSPRYKHNLSGIYMPMEVGPLARMVVAGAYFAGVLNVLGYGLTPVWNAAGPNLSAGGHPLQAVYAAIPPGGRTGGPNLSGVLYKGDSVLDRIAARAVETRLMVDMAQHFLNQLSGSIDGTGYGTTGVTDPAVPNTLTVKKGYGMTEASRGALSHWIKMKSGKTTLYQAVVPTTWNANPRDVYGIPGPSEQSLMSGGGAWVANPAEPIELPRITHSYDFCIACAVHLISPEGEVTKVDVPALPS